MKSKIPETYGLKDWALGVNHRLVVCVGGQIQEKAGGPPQFFLSSLPLAVLVGNTLLCTFPGLETLGVRLPVTQDTRFCSEKVLKRHIHVD